MDVFEFQILSESVADSPYCPSGTDSGTDTDLFKRLVASFFDFFQRIKFSPITTRTRCGNGFPNI